jgi:hypothetical protein
VLQGTARAGGYTDIEELLHGREVGDGGGGKIPVLKGFVDEVAGVGGAIAA